MTRRIHEKLAELGYQEVDFPTTKNWDKLVSKPTELTENSAYSQEASCTIDITLTTFETEWMTLYPLLEEEIRQKRQRDLAACLKDFQDARRAVVLTYIQDLFFNKAPGIHVIFPDPFPNRFFASELPAVKALIDKCCLSGQSITHQDVLAALRESRTHLAQFATDYTDHLIYTLFIARVRDATPARPSLYNPAIIGPTMLERADAFFNCNACRPLPRSSRPEERQTVDNVMTSTGLSAHWRESHPNRAWHFRERRAPDGTLEWGAQPWAGQRAHRWVACVLDAIWTSWDTPRSVMDVHVQHGVFFCACGDPSLPPRPQLTWAVLVSTYITTPAKRRQTYPHRLRTFSSTYSGMKTGAKQCM